MDLYLYFLGVENSKRVGIYLITVLYTNVSHPKSSSTLYEGSPGERCPQTGLDDVFWDVSRDHEPNYETILTEL